ncbi:hypothetical protein [Streptomyces yaizuensis]|uniref:Membrane protein n=1 Tax=Streptomyces yaizuensis TaxID=2989713 RepID=A0ABQ5P888_9ACTN|nr:hypothetical protein [Streptomyces sp. YSPA8]GLF98782.1 membrane protein [Streptomyces sp. YSPA8]
MARRTTAEHHKLTFLRVAIALQTSALLFQTVTAGLLMSSSHGRAPHDIGSPVMYGASMVYVLAAILAWRPGGGPFRPVLYASGFLVLASAQVALGIAQVTRLHVPLGILMFGLSVVALARVLSARSEQGSRTRP